MSNIKKYWGVVLVVALTPVLLWAAIQILPTFDDWRGTTSPSFEPLFRKENFFFYGYHWRPFDCIAGYISGLNPQLLYPLQPLLRGFRASAVRSRRVFSDRYVRIRQKGQKHRYSLLFHRPRYNGHRTLGGRLQPRICTVF